MKSMNIPPKTQPENMMIFATQMQQFLDNASLCTLPKSNVDKIQQLAKKIANLQGMTCTTQDAQTLKSLCGLIVLLAKGEIKS